MNYDFVIVGAGLFGSIFAREAKDAGKSVLVLDRRDHIGGNCYSYDYEDTKISVHRYGTHIFHTNSEEIWRYINRFTGFNRYQHRVLTTRKNKVFALPINLGTINQFYGLNLKPGDVDAFIETKREGIPSPSNLEEKAISLIGRDLYEAFIKDYTMKQWGCDPKELPANIITRLPVRKEYFDSYFDDLYQGIPVEGYTPIFERLLEGIPVELKVDFFDDRAYWRSLGRSIVYTGPIDRYFDYQFGRLQWRSVRLDVERIELEDFQGTSVMNFADSSVPFTRIHEPKHLHREKEHLSNSTVIMREFSHLDHEQPFYPVNMASDKAILAHYQKLQRRETNVVFGGRLAEYKYYDMDQVISSAIQKVRDVLEK